MNHRHLLPNEIDLLVDGEAGFGVAPLRAHIQECAECRERLDDAQVVVDALQVVPHFAPDSRLADRVMARVPVFVPAHVAARDSVQRFVPSSAPWRVAALAAAASMAGVFTLALVWLASRGDAVVFMSGVLGDRIRTAVLGAGRDVALALLGESAMTALQSTGALGASLLVLAFLLTGVGTVAGIRRLATISHQS